VLTKLLNPVLAGSVNLSASGDAPGEKAAIASPPALSSPRLKICDVDLRLKRKVSGRPTGLDEVNPMHAAFGTKLEVMPPRSQLIARRGGASPGLPAEWQKVASRWMCLAVPIRWREGIKAIVEIGRKSSMARENQSLKTPRRRHGKNQSPQVTVCNGQHQPGAEKYGCGYRRRWRVGSWARLLQGSEVFEAVETSRVVILLGVFDA